MIWKVKPRSGPPLARSRRKITVVSAATISTTNITGFFIISRGSSLAKDAVIAGHTIFGSSIAEADVRLLALLSASMEVTPNEIDQYRLPAVIARCSTIGPNASAGKKVSPPMIRITPTTRPTNRPPVVGNVPADGGTDFLAASEPAIAIAGMIMKKRPTNIALAKVRL